MTAALAEPAVGFLRDIVADPADDAVRLIYADWLEENGQPERAEFVRVQVELASCIVVAGGKELERRERELLEAHGAAWVCTEVPALAAILKDVAEGERIQDRGARYRRGFVAHVTLTLADFEKHAAALFAAAPIEGVRLADREPSRLGELWQWTRAVGDGEPDDLPAALFDAFHGSPCGMPGSSYRFRVYRSCDVAHAALSAACITHGRRLAGLPELKTGEAADV